MTLNPTPSPLPN